jgi:hypothetical protein
MAVITNRHSWTDVIDLIAETKTPDADGYDTIVETPREVFCNFQDGVARNEFYAGMKAGMRPTATVEVWEDDYDHEELCEYDGTRFSVIRNYPSGSGTMILILQKVIR